MRPAPEHITAPQRLCILLIAYEFPPSPSPQSLRWAYLSARLARFGHEVHILTPNLGPMPVWWRELGGGVHLHRVWPGPVQALLARLQNRRKPLAARDDASAHATPARPVVPEGPRGLNWKGRLLQAVYRAVSWSLFPDIRGEWRWPGSNALMALLNELKPDVVVSSHEPATTLEIGLSAKRLGYAWVADVADPVLASYTPPRWRRRARRLESRVMERADHVLLTSPSAMGMLRGRHTVCADMTVVAQGYDDDLPPPEPVESGAAALELLYAGSFYSFRDPRGLVEAVIATAGARLSIATWSVPPWLADAARMHPDSIRLLGHVPHRRLLHLQREVHVLVNLANADPAQVPGKFYEYLGAGRPILHLHPGEEDSVGQLLSQLRRGWACRSDRPTIEATLNKLVMLHRAASLTDQLELGMSEVRRWSWTEAARRVEAVLTASVRSQSMLPGDGACGKGS